MPLTVQATQNGGPGRSRRRRRRRRTGTAAWVRVLRGPVTRQDFAGILGVSDALVKRWEQGTAIPSPEEAGQIEAVQRAMQRVHDHARRPDGAPCPACGIEASHSPWRPQLTTLFSLFPHRLRYVPKGLVTEVLHGRGRPLNEPVGEAVEFGPSGAAGRVAVARGDGTTVRVAIYETVAEAQVATPDLEWIRRVL